MYVRVLSVKETADALQEPNSSFVLPIYLVFYSVLTFAVVFGGFALLCL